MEQASNIFTDGLVTDSHPLTTPNNALTDALNATFRTHNGNELMIQNDMGNTTICDSTTGNIMGLEDGFVPVGMKEYGGILYIASYNQETKEGQLGTIPSPVFNYTYSLGQSLNRDLALTFDNTTEANLYYNSKLYRHDPFQVSTQRLNPGDKFIPILKIDGLAEQIYRRQYNETLYSETNPPIYPISAQGETSVKTTSVDYSKISGFSNTGSSVFGLYRASLLAKIINTADTFTLNNISSKQQTYYLEGSFTRVNSKYWFIDSQTYEASGKILDQEICQADKCYRTYPNILPGYLYCSIEPELIENVQLFINQNTGVNSPITYII